MQLFKRKKKKNNKGFTLVELVVVILVIAILATATFLGGATVIKQSRKSKVQTNLSNYATYVQDMMYAEPGIVNKTDAQAKELLNGKYLTKDFQLDDTKDSWNKSYEFDFVTCDVNDEDGKAHKCTYIIISSNGSNGIKEMGDLMLDLTATDYLSAQTALDGITLTTGDDLGLVILLRDGAVSTAYYGFNGSSAAPTAPAVTMLNGADQIYTGASPLVFRSSAEMSTFVEVKIDNSTVAPANYTVTEGSTIIMFTDAYTKSLANDNHTVEIVSTVGTASADFEVDIPYTVVTKNGTTITSTFAALKIISAEIAEETSLTKEQISTRHGINIGDTIVVDGLTCYVADFNHDSANGESGITLVANTNQSHAMNNTDTNAGGWTTSVMRTWLNDTVLSTLTTINANAKTVTKKSDTGTNTIDSTQSYKLCDTQDKLWLLSYEEVFPRDYPNYTTYMQYVVAGQGTVYPIFTADNSSRTKVEGSSYWWLRSASRYGGGFRGVYCDGDNGFSCAINSFRAVVGFCI